MRLFPPAGAPEWLNLFTRDIEKTIRGPRDAPMQLQAYADAAALPDPAQWRHGLAYLSDIEMVAVSTGTAWKRLDTGATL